MSQKRKPLNIVEMVEDILDRNNIRYQHLVVKNVGTKNTIITDGQNVLVKMKGIEKSVEEFSSDVYFTANNPGKGFPLLIPEVVHPFKRGLEASFSVWKFENCRVLGANTLTPKQAVAAVHKLYDIHQSEQYVELQRRTDDITDRIHRHLSSVQFKTLKAVTQHKVKDFYEQVAQQAILFMSPPVFGAVVAHGKAMPNRLNVKEFSNEVRWSDFETVRLTRKEYDLAALKISLKISGTNIAAWEAAEETYRSFYPDLETSLVNQFASLLICERVFHFASQVSTIEKEEELESFMRNAESILDGELPTYLRLPTIRGENLQ